MSFVKWIDYLVRKNLRRTRLKYSGYRKSPAISRTRCTVVGCLSMRLHEKRNEVSFLRVHLAESRSRAKPIFLQRPRLTYARISNACTWYPTMSHLLHALTLLHANSYPWPFVSYSDARTDTGNIRLFDGGGKNARGRPLYAPATSYKWSSFRRGRATWNLNYFFPQPFIIMSFPSLRTFEYKSTWSRVQL